MSDKKSTVKKRNWAFVVYPSQAQLPPDCTYDGSDGYGTLPSDWLDILRLSGLQFAISPLHDRDVNADGSIKKPHYHCISVYGSPTTYNNVKTLTDSLNAPGPQPLEQVRGYYRYFTHADNPEKAQYSSSDIIVGGGFNISDFTELSRSEISEIKKRLVTFIRDNKIEEYSDFMNILLDSDMSLEFDVASSNTIFFDKYISSIRYKKLSQIRDSSFDKYSSEPVSSEPLIFKVDPTTGEVLP